MIKKIFALLILSIPLFSSSLHADQLAVTVNGTNVNLDWSAMPEAQFYTLYYAFADVKGDIDVNTLGWLEMGTGKSLYVPGLPSGLIIYAAILAHATPGDVLSNIAPFMPFGGTLSYPETGNVRMIVDDPGGIGNVAIMGTVCVDESDMYLSQISGNNGSGAFALFITDNKPVYYTKENITATFLYRADGSVGLEVMNGSATLSSVQKESADQPVATVYETVEAAIDCSVYGSEDEYREMVSHSVPFLNEVKIRASTAGLTDVMNAVCAAIALIQTNPERLRIPKYQKLQEYLLSYLQVLKWAYEDIEETYLDELASAYVRDCGDSWIPPTPDCDKNCPIPPGATFINNDEFNETYYWLNGHVVGLWKARWDDGSLKFARCYDANGLKNGTECYWRNDGTLSTYGIYDAGRAESLTYYRDDGITPGRFFTYDENGVLQREYSYYEDGDVKEVCTYEEGMQTECTAY